LDALFHIVIDDDGNVEMGFFLRPMSKKELQVEIVNEFASYGRL
jgi:hypothetical protein